MPDFEMQQRRVVDLPSAVFALLVSGGGVYGYLKARSVPSLVSGLAFGSLLLLGSHQLARGDVRLLFGGSASLAMIMAVRYKNTGKIMPAGFVCALSLLMTLRCAYIMWK